MPRMRMLFLTIILSLAAGCKADSVRRGLYEGVRVRNDLQSTPSERVGQPDAPGFATYERMRSELPHEPQ